MDVTDKGWLTDEELEGLAAGVRAGDPLAPAAAGRVLAELVVRRRQMDRLGEAVLSSDMRLDFKIAAGILLDPDQADRVDTRRQAQLAARHQQVAIEELERVRFVLEELPDP